MEFSNASRYCLGPQDAETKERRAQQAGPPVRLSVLRRNLANLAHCDAFIEGLKKAGVPE